MPFRFFSKVIIIKSKNSEKFSCTSWDFEHFAYLKILKY